MTNGWLRLRKIDFRSESFVSRMFLLAKKSIFLCLAHPFVSIYLSAWLVDLIFPPLCRNCKETCKTKFFCLECWKLFVPPDPLSHCRHCFEELEEKGPLCPPCARNPHLAVHRALVFDTQAPVYFLDRDLAKGFAGFGYLQWLQLDWPTPDAVIPFAQAEPIAKTLAQLMEAPYLKALLPDGSAIEERLEPDQILLLVSFDTRKEEIERAVQSLLEAFPKRIYLLTYFEK